MLFVVYFNFDIFSLGFIDLSIKSKDNGIRGQNHHSCDSASSVQRTSHNRISQLLLHFTVRVRTASIHRSIPIDVKITPSSPHEDATSLPNLSYLQELHIVYSENHHSC